MPRPSSIDQLPDEVRAAIGQLRTRGWTIDQILEHLHGMGAAPSRSALGRHVKGLDQIAEKVRRSRDVATALARELGDAPESQVARANIELMHGAILDLSLKAAEGEGDEEGQAALNGNPEGVMMLAKALDHLGSASKKNEEFVARVEARATAKAKTEAATAATEVARQRGLSPELVDAIRAGIFGVPA